MQSFFHRHALATFLLAAFAAATQAQPPQLDPQTQNRLDMLRQRPEIAGEPVYRGAVFAPQDSALAELFHYERRVGKTADGLSASHITHDPSGEVIIEETVRVSPRYELQRLDVANRQAGFSGTAVVSPDGRRLDFHLNQGGQIRSSQEDVTDPVLAGPSLHGFILEHWKLLSDGGKLAVRMVVMAKMQTYGFEIRQVTAPEPLVRFSVTPSSLLVRLLVAPLTVTFDATDRHLVRYEGRVPPLREMDGKLQDFDARVEYTMLVPRYR